MCVSSFDRLFCLRTAGKRKFGATGGGARRWCFCLVVSIGTLVKGFGQGELDNEVTLSWVRSLCGISSVNTVETEGIVRWLELKRTRGL